MADWVLKGSLKGPQGDPGADAQLPEGGGTGDFLQKKADGTGWFDSEGLLRASYIGTLQQLGDEGQSLEIHDVSVTSNGYVAGVSTDNPPEDGAFVYANDKNSAHTGHNRVGVLNGIPYVDLGTTDAAGENGHLAADGRYSYVDDIEAADAAGEQGEALTIPTGAAVKQYVTAHAGDALPEGGTDGQVLTKTAGGEAWEDVPAPDMTGVVKTDATGCITSGGSMITFGVKDSSEQNYAKLHSMHGGRVSLSTNTGVSGLEISSSNGNMISLSVAYGPGETLTIGPKSIHSITDSISASPAGNALTTDKAVADYVAENASSLPEGGTTGQVLTKTDTGTEWADAAGGGGLELLWEGVATIEQGEYADLNVDLGSHDLILVVGDHGDDSICFATIVRPIGEKCHHFTGYQSDAYISADATYIFGPVFYTTHIYKVYAIPISGGGGTVIYDRAQGIGNYTEQFNAYPYSKIVVTGTYNGQPVTDTYEAPFGDVQKSFTLMSLESSMVGITYVTISGLHSPAYCTIDSITAYK